MHFEKTLGSVTYGNMRTPRTLVSIENTEQAEAETAPTSPDAAWREVL